MEYIDHTYDQTLLYWLRKFKEQRICKKRLEVCMSKGKEQKRYLLPNYLYSIQSQHMNQSCQRQDSIGTNDYIFSVTNNNLPGYPSLQHVEIVTWQKLYYRLTDVIVTPAYQHQEHDPRDHNRSLLHEHSFHCQLNTVKHCSFTHKIKHFTKWKLASHWE